MRDCMLLAGMGLIYLGVCEMGNRGDAVVSMSTICMGLPPVDGSSFEVLLLQSHSSYFHSPTPVR